MIKFENVKVIGWETAIRGMRNPMNSWEKSDSGWVYEHQMSSGASIVDREDSDLVYVIGPNDLDLMKRLRESGTDHRKFMRMITVYIDIIAPLYWWKEFDTYKVGTVANSCSTMHKIHAKEFTVDDFSCEHLLCGEALKDVPNNDGNCVEFDGYGCMKNTICMLNKARELYLQTRDKRFWLQMIQLLPSSYNQKRTVMLNYEVLANIYKSRKNHKLNEWSVGFYNLIKTMPCSDLITGEFKEN